MFCVGWHLAVIANHSSKCALCELAAVLHINKRNAAGNSKKVVHHCTKPTEYVDIAKLELQY